MQTENEILKARLKTSQGPAVYKLKCWPEYFNAISSGEKTFDVRQGNDRLYKVGDMLHFQEYDPKTSGYTGRALMRRVTYVMHGKPFLPDDFWVLSFGKDFE